MTTLPCVDTNPPKELCIENPDATFIARSSVIIPFPESPAAAKTTGTPRGIVSAIRNFCSGALPTNISDMSKLLSFKEMVCLVLCCGSFKNLLMSKPSVIASETSHFSGLPLGGDSIVTDLAPALEAKSWTNFAIFMPALSLSGQIMTCLPCNGEKS